VESAVEHRAGEFGPAIVVAERAAFSALAADLCAGLQILLVGDLDSDLFKAAAGRRVTNVTEAAGTPDGPFDVVVADIAQADQAASDFVDELPRLAGQGLIVIRIPNRPDCRALREQITAVYPNRRALRQHNWVSSAVLDDEQFAEGDPARAFASNSRKLAGAAPGAELYTIIVAGEGELPLTAAQVVLTRSLDVRSLLEREAAAYARARDAEIEAQMAREAQQDRVRELEERIAWLQEWELDVQDKVEQRGWAMKLLKTWVIVVKVTRKINLLITR
jgi:hypothetical protein